VRILLTGGSGFVGRHVLEGLGERYTIVAPTHGELDILDAAAVDAALRGSRFDAVIHAAVQGGASVMQTTLRGFWNLARNAGRVHRLVYFGSGAEFAKHRDLVKVKEEQLGEETPRDDYGFAKLLSTQLCRESANIVNLRLFGLYGPYEGCKAKFISNAIAKTLAGIPITIRQDVVFDYLWIDDLIRVLPRFLEGERAFADVNVTPTASARISDIAAMVRRAAGQSPECEIELPGMNFQYTGANARLLELCPELAFTPPEEGVRRLFAYYRERIETIDREALEADEYRRRLTTRAMETHT
jgi:nucleoside-diphosphate-sugar epimerase